MRAPHVGVATVATFGMGTQHQIWRQHDPISHFPPPRPRRLVVSGSPYRPWPRAGPTSRSASSSASRRVASPTCWRRLIGAEAAGAAGPAGGRREQGRVPPERSAPIRWPRPSPTATPCCSGTATPTRSRLRSIPSCRTTWCVTSRRSSRVATTPLLLTVNAAVPAKDVQSLHRVGQEQAGRPQLRLVGQRQRASTWRRRASCCATKTSMTHVPYKGSGQAIVDLLSGNGRPQLREPAERAAAPEGGKLRALAHHERQALAAAARRADARRSGRRRTPRCCSGSRCSAPAGLPQPILQKLSTEIDAILKQPDVVEKIASQGGEIVGGSPREFADVPAARQRRLGPAGQGSQHPVSEGSASAARRDRAGDGATRDPRFRGAT